MSATPPAHRTRKGKAMERGAFLAFVTFSLFLLSIAAASAARGQGIVPTCWQGPPGEPGW